MERLTEKHYGANDYYMTCSEECERDNCVECAAFEKIVDRLGEYEDTGLTPESVEALKVSMMGKTVSEITEFEGLPIDHLKELAKADKEGRLVVLPCKMRDTVYFAAWFGTGPHIVKRIVLPFFFHGRCGKR